LGIFPALLQIHPPVTLVTASVPIQRSVIVLEVKILDRTNAPIGDFVDVEAVVVPGPPNRDRCSGMFIRKSFYTTTAPDAQEKWDYYTFAYCMTSVSNLISSCL
jgi:hypothetical protein